MNQGRSGSRVLLYHILPNHISFDYASMSRKKCLKGSLRGYYFVSGYSIEILIELLMGTNGFEIGQNALLISNI